MTEESSRVRLHLRPDELQQLSHTTTVEGRDVAGSP